MFWDFMQIKLIFGIYTKWKQKQLRMNSDSLAKTLKQTNQALLYLIIWIILIPSVYKIYLI